jgi:putative hydrolase of the HAD superfamily
MEFGPEHEIKGMSDFPVAGVTLDVGGTLIEPWPSVGQIYADVAALHGFEDIPVELLDRRFKVAWSSCPGFDYTRAGWEKLVTQTFNGLLASTAVPFFPELYERFAESEVWRRFDDVLPTLEHLAALNLRLAVVSNWDERLRILLKRLNLEDHFELVIVSCEVGFTKPSPFIFEHAAKRLGLPPASILHVGDSLEMDVTGATTAGFRALHLKRHAAEAVVDGEIKSLAELRTRINS